MGKDINLPMVIGHRGVIREDIPENTLKAFRAAKEFGAEWIEIDAILTKDGVPVILHDEHLDKTTNGKGPVDEVTLEELKKLDAGNGEQVPTLDETLKLLKELDLKVNVEIKPSRPEMAEETTKKTIEVMKKYGFDEKGKSFVSSFDRNCMFAAHRIAPEIPRGVLAGETKDWAQVANKIDASGITFNQKNITPELVGKVKKLGVSLLAYTVNKPEDANKLWKMGVDSVFSDRPDIMVKEAEKYKQNIVTATVKKHHSR